MALTREHLLKELELLPVWQPKNLAAHAQLAPTPTASAAQEPELPSQALAMPIQVKLMETGEAAKGVSSLDARLSPETQANPALAFEPPLPEKAGPVFALDLQADASAHIAQPASLDATEARAEHILKLDWPALQQHVPTCTACELAKTRTQTVFGVGDPQAEWLIVGEAPGAEEDRKGEPFVGQAGKLLDNMLAAIQLQRGKNVYIANVLKCRPPENRDPHGVEVAQCDPYLKRQVELIQPKLIIALGKFAAQSLLNSDDTIASLRGKKHLYQGVPVIVTYHPAYLLRNLPDKAKAWEDLCFARDTMQALQNAATAPLI